MAQAVAVANAESGEQKPKQPTWKVVLLIVGVVLLLGGCAAVYFGLKPLAPLMELFTGGAQAAEKNQEWLDNLDQHLGDAALPVGGGIGALLAGFVMVKVGMAPPKPPTVDELVNRAVEERLRGMNVALAVAAPATPAKPATPAAPMAPSLPWTYAAAPAAPSAAAPVGSQSAAPPRAPVAAPHPVASAAPPPAAKACPKCGGRLAAGGRICLSCRSTFA